MWRYGLMAISMLVAGCGQKAEWKELAPPGLNFRVEMPGTWAEKSLDADGSRQLEAKVAVTEYGVILHKLPKANVSRDESRKVMEAVRDGTVGALAGGKVTESSDTELGGWPGLQFLIAGSDGTIIRARLYVVEPYVYTVAASYRKTPSSPADIEQFFRSFAFTTTSPAASPTVASTGTSLTPSSAGEDRPTRVDNDRLIWYFEKAPQVFPDQSGFVGIFRLEGQRWYDHAGSTTHDYNETARSADFVELTRPAGDFQVRLHNGKSEYRFGSTASYTLMFPGRWLRPAPLSKTADGKPTEADSDRLVWYFHDVPKVFPDQAGTYGGFFKDGNTWRGPKGMSMLDFTEGERTSEFIELLRPGGFKCRLYADRSEYTRGGNQWTPMFAGAWWK